MLRVLVLVLLGLLGAVPPAAADSGPWGWPLAGPHAVSRAFAPPASTYGAGHRGADLPGSPGAAVRASAAGRVTYAGLLAGRGVVVVTHGALRTTYEPVEAAVRVEQVVARGEVVGRLSPGHAGCPVEACLHWGLRRGQEYLDPVRLVERGPVRLLPLSGGGLGGSGGLGRSGGQLRGGDDVQPAGVSAPGTRSPASSVGDPLLTVDAGRGSPGDGRPAPRRGGMLLAPGPVAEPSWSVRAAEAPLGAAAVVALVLGIGLLARPRPLPPGPASGGVPAPAATPVEEPPGEPGLLLDLDAARARRQAS